MIDCNGTLSLQENLRANSKYVTIWCFCKWEWHLNSSGLGYVLIPFISSGYVPLSKSIFILLLDLWQFHHATHPLKRQIQVCIQYYKKKTNNNKMCLMKTAPVYLTPVCCMSVASSTNEDSPSFYQKLHCPHTAKTLHWIQVRNSQIPLLTLADCIRRKSKHFCYHWIFKIHVRPMGQICPFAIVNPAQHVQVVSMFTSL